MDDHRRAARHRRDRAAASLALTRGAQRAYLAGTIGGGVAVFCLFWLGVFFHGAVVSALSPESTRFLCSVAFAAGMVSLIGLFAIDGEATGPP